MSEGVVEVTKDTQPARVTEAPIQMMTHAEDEILEVMERLEGDTRC